MNPKRGNPPSKPLNFVDFEISVGSAYTPTRREDAHLYVISAEITQRVKIGSARDVFTRFRQLQAASPDKLTLYAWAEWCGRHETIIHHHFKAHRVHGEWFTRAVLDELAQRVSPTTEHRWGASNELEIWVEEIAERSKFVEIFTKPLTKHRKR